VTALATIGAGLMAQEIARLAVAAGDEVVLSRTRDPGTLSGLTAELGPLASAATPRQAAERADVVVLALPLGRLPELDPAPLVGKPVIDLTNYYPHRDGRVADLDSGAATAGQYVQRLLPGARTVRVFTNISYAHIPLLARPHGAADRSALPLTGDDPRARELVVALVDRLGFDPVDVGGHEESWRFEPDTAAYLTPYAAGPLERLEDLQTTPAAPLTADTLRGLLDRAERADQGSRVF
jgi:8-hydroxy-5-deazaflavin:NADPH oxidoreductase